MGCDFSEGAGGLLIGATIKYASAISKNFASACAIVLTAALSREARISTTFRSGILAVVASMVMFQACPPKKLSESSVTKLLASYRVASTASLLTALCRVASTASRCVPPEGARLPLLCLAVPGPGAGDASRTQSRTQSPERRRAGCSW